MDIRKDLTEIKRYQHLLLLGHMLVWFALYCFIRPSISNTPDMYELYSWGINPQWGTFKHPPFLSWLVGLWFQIFPTTDWAFKLLSVLNTTLAVYFTGRFTQGFFQNNTNDDKLKSERLALLAMSWVAMTLFYGNLALRLNMNSILLSLFPLLAWLWIIAMQKANLWLDILLGIVAATVILSKYYSGVFLYGLFIATLLFKPGRDWLQSRHPYISLVFFVLLVVPHIYWVVEHDFITLKYVDERDINLFSYKRVLSFVAMQFVTAIFAFLVIYWSGRPWIKSKYSRQSKLVISSLIIIPLGLSILISWIKHLPLAAPWGMPLAFIWPVLFFTFFETKANINTQTKFVRNGLLVYWLLSIIIYAANHYKLANAGNYNYYQPRAEFAASIAPQAMNINWVAGDWEYASALSFYSKNKIYATPNYPNGSLIAQIHMPKDWQQQNGLIICRLHEPNLNILGCGSEIQLLLQQNNLNYIEENITLARQGWHFPLNKLYSFGLVWVKPKIQ